MIYVSIFAATYSAESKIDRSGEKPPTNHQRLGEKQNEVEMKIHRRKSWIRIRCCNKSNQIQLEVFQAILNYPQTLLF